MFWFERVLVRFLAAICEVSGLDADRLAVHQRERMAPPAPPDSRRTQTVHRIR